jgi:hypothetical protein
MAQVSIDRLATQRSTIDLEGHSDGDKVTVMVISVLGKSFYSLSYLMIFF